MLFILAAISTTLLDTQRTADVRQAMLWGLLVLIPALVTAATGSGVAGTATAKPTSKIKL